MLHELAPTIEAWRTTGTDFAVVRATHTLGLGSRILDEVLLVNADGATAGHVAGASASERARDVVATVVLDGERRGTAPLVIEVSSAEAASDGLDCAGHVDALAQRLDGAPGLLFAALHERAPVTLAVPSRPSADLPTWLVVTAEASAGSLGVASVDASAIDDARYQLSRGTPERRLVQYDDTDVLLELFAPTPRLVVVGGGELSAALERQGVLLGWDVRATAAVGDTLTQVSEMGPGDALVVLSHDAEVDAPALAAAFDRGIGYVGALGSRRTQAARRARLRERGITDGQVDSIHGPVGLDLGARTPAETALAVFAEIVAARSGRSAASLRSHSGPINTK
jgi:xanthine dehydrogenase accessory factor